MSKLSHLKNLRRGINALESLQLFKIKVNFIKSTGIFTTTKDELILNSSEGRSLKNSVEELRLLTATFLESLTESSVSIRDNTIYIKLPPVKGLDDLSKVVSTFNLILTQAIVNDEIKGEVEIDNVESGSIWLDIFVGSSSAITLLGGLAWSAAVVFKKIQEGRIIQEHVKSLKIKNESLKDIKEAQEKSLDLLIAAEANQLYVENFKENNGNNDQIERLKHSIKLLSDQIDKGAEIHPALNAPENVANLFPDMKKLEGVESRIKKLTN